MAMTAFYMGNGASKRKHGEPFIDHVDKNGTEHWVDHNCPKCGGTGYLPGYEFIDGARCWKCNASGYYPHTWKKYKPEYEAKLIAKRETKTRQKNLEDRPNFLAKNGFNVDGTTYVIIGNTFDIKDELKAAGAKYCAQLGWHFIEKPENWPSIEMTVADCFWENDIGALHWNDTCDIQELIKKRTPHEPSTSEYISEVGKRITITVKLKKSFSFEGAFGITYIHNFEDENGNVIIWKTTNSLVEYAYLKDRPEHYVAHPLITCTLTGVVKEQSEYKGVRQTVMTRCKTTNIERD